MTANAGSGAGEVFQEKACIQLARNGHGPPRSHQDTKSLDRPGSGATGSRWSVLVQSDQADARRGEDRGYIRRCLEETKAQEFWPS